MWLKYEFFSKRGGDPGRTKSFEALYFALKQSKANKCQRAKRLKTVKKLFLNFFLNIFGKSDSGRFGKIPEKATYFVRGLPLPASPALLQLSRLPLARRP